MADILGISTSALQSLQRAISTTGHNIANANTDGYSRQSVTFATRPPQREGDSFIGSGTVIESVRRSYDRFLGNEVLNRTSSFNSLQSYHELAARLENLVADQNGGLNTSLQAFFGALQDVANDPASLPAREVLLGSAQILQDRVRYLNNGFDALTTNSNQRLESTVDEINSLASSIAEANLDISGVQLGSTDMPNDLLDKRDQLITQLSAKIGITTIQQADGSLNILVGSGQPLVVGTQVQPLSTEFNSLDASRLEVTFAGSTASGGNVISGQLRGGELQGILDFRQQVLDPTRRELGLLVQGLTALVNEQHRLGIDLNGQPGGDFFTPLNVPTAAASDNTGSAVVSAVIDDINALQPTDYQLSYDGSQWALRNISDNSVQNYPALPVSVAGITVNSTGTPQAGDTFLIRPVGAASSQFNLELERAEQFAAAGPLRTRVAIGNTGNADITGLRVANNTALPLPGPITLTFDANAVGPGVPGFVVTGGPGGTLAYDPATDSGGTSFTLTGFGDATFQISGVPTNGDTFTLENNNGGIGDNNNALALAVLQTGRHLKGNTSTISELYGRAVANVGVRTSQAQANMGTEQALMANAEQQLKSVSGVNLDEEAANLLRYQQAYQAAAQVIAAVDELFNTLLSATR